MGATLGCVSDRDNSTSGKLAATHSSPRGRVLFGLAPDTAMFAF
jgi:hypothetical protein